MRYWIALVIVVAIGPRCVWNSDPGVAREPEEQPDPGVGAGHRYPDFGFLPPPSQYEGRVFKLSQEYPQAKPQTARIPAICTGDFDAIKRNWKKYLMDVRAYCFKGN